MLLGTGVSICKAKRIFNDTYQASIVSRAHGAVLPAVAPSTIRSVNVLPQHCPHASRSSNKMLISSEAGKPSRRRWHLLHLLQPSDVESRSYESRPPNAPLPLLVAKQSLAGLFSFLHECCSLPISLLQCFSNGSAARHGRRLFTSPKAGKSDFSPVRRVIAMLYE